MESTSGEMMSEACPEKLFHDNTLPWTSGSFVVLMMEDDVGAEAA